VTINDIKFYHSGGGGNCDPDFDLGGSRSTCELAEGLNTLFDTLGSVESRTGKVDYRCFYVKNTHSTETLRDAVIYIASERKSGSFIDLGIPVSKEVQKIIISGTTPPNENDYIDISLSGYISNMRVVYNDNQTLWRARMQAAFRSIDGLNGVIVSVSGVIGFPTNLVFTVSFDGEGINHELPSMTVAESLNNCTASVVVTTNGTPVNTTAVTIPNKTTAPSGINFEYPLLGSPIKVGSLKPSDEFPVWVRRTTPPKTLIYIKDNFEVNVDGTFP
jgi:hypothetical protein